MKTNPFFKIGTAILFAEDICDVPLNEAVAASLGFTGGIPRGDEKPWCLRGIRYHGGKFVGFLSQDYDGNYATWSLELNPDQCGQLVQLAFEAAMAQAAKKTKEEMERKLLSILK